MPSLIYTFIKGQDWFKCSSALQISFQDYAISSYYLFSIRKLSSQHILLLNISKYFSNFFFFNAIVNPNIVNFIPFNRFDDFGQRGRQSLNPEIKIIKKKIQFRLYFLRSKQSFHCEQPHLFCSIHRHLQIDLRKKPAERKVVLSQLTWKAKLIGNIICYLIISQGFFQILLIGIKPVHVIHAADAFNGGLWVSFYQMQGMDKLIDILEAAIHTEASCWSVSMRSVSSKENVLLKHFICELGLQLPSSHVDNIQV